MLSKSTFLRGVGCKKSLFLDTFHHELRDPLPESAQRLMMQGQQVGELAREVFPGGILARQGGPFDFAGAIQCTQTLIAGGTPVIYEAALQAEGVLAFLDILVRGGHGWRLYEVKSSTEVKAQHLLDVALQVYLLSQLGMEVEDAAVLHINRAYMREGELDLQALFMAESVLDDVMDLLPGVSQEIEMCKAVLDAGRIPAVDIGPHCTELGCDFMRHCWAHVPTPSVFDISRIGAKKFELYNRGIVRIEDIPADFPLSPTSRFHVESHKAWRETIEQGKLRAFLETLQYPHFFLDFETFNLAIPPFDGIQPYQQVPFQYSLHIREARGAPVRHSGFLAEGGCDPRPSFLKRLHAETQGSGSIVVYNQAFEKGCLQKLEQVFPEHSSWIQDRIRRMVDLLVPFRARQFYKPEMHGSASLKAVTPALVPELSYAGMDVADGTQATNAFLSLWDEHDPEQVARVRKALWAYCELDTLAMVRILEVVEGLVEGYGI